MPPRPAPSLWRDYGRHAVLFLLTFLSIFLTGALQETARGTFLDVVSGAELAVSLVAILLTHEMGHYLACRYYKVEATLPFFIPAPIINPLVGTLGAVIRIRSPFPSRRALFDIGIAGPLAGFVVCLPVLVLGVLEATIVPEPSSSLGGVLGDPLLFRWAVHWLRGEVPPGMTLLIGPFGLAAWFGLFMTALNLIPIGQLDGGHVTYALLGPRAVYLSRAVWLGCVAMVFLVGPSWVLWSILVFLLGIRHPRTLNDQLPVGRARVLVGLLGLVVFVVSFLPNPFLVSWSDFLDAWRGAR